jgi:AcrR family transcriptional regulator
VDERRGTANDRRILRTRHALHKALISLVLERGYEAVTIKDVVDRANVGRSTFYTHYTSKEDLLTAEIEDLRATLLAEQRAALCRQGVISERSLGFSRALFEHAQDYRDVYRALVGERGASIIVARMRALFTQLVREELSELLPRFAQDNVPRSALVQFVVGALMSILTWWLEGGSDLESAQVDAIFRRLTVPAIEAALQNSYLRRGDEEEPPPPVPICRA